MSGIMRARHWRQRAEELRSIAALTRGKEAKATLLRLAEELEQMAERIDKQEGKS